MRAYFRLSPIRQCACWAYEKKLRRKLLATELLMFWSVFVWLPSVGATELIALDILPSKLSLYLLVVDQLACGDLLA